MDAIEKIAGETEEQIRQRDWPSKDSLVDYTWPNGVALRGSVRLATGLISDRIEIAKEWLRVSGELRKLL